MSFRGSATILQADDRYMCNDIECVKYRFNWAQTTVVKVWLHWQWRTVKVMSSFKSNFVLFPLKTTIMGSPDVTWCQQHYFGKVVWIFCCVGCHAGSNINTNHYLLSLVYLMNCALRICNVYFITGLWGCDLQQGEKMREVVSIDF